MKEVVSLIYELKNKGLKVELDTEALNLKVKGNTQLLSEADRTALTALKPEIIRFLSDKQVKRSVHTAIPRVPVSRDYAVSSAQQRLWVLSQFEASNAAYNMPAALVADGVLDKELLELSFLEIIARYEILRTVFNVDDAGEVRQYVKEVHEFDFSISFFDLRSEKDPEQALKMHLRTAEATPFDLAAGPLFRVALFRPEDHKQVLFVNIHHIICDGTSLEMLLAEVMARYSALNGGDSQDWPELRVQYKDYAHWQREQLNESVLNVHRAYWLEHLGGRLPVLALPAALERPAVMTYNGSSVTETLSKETTRQLKALVQAHGATLFMGLLAGMNALFYRYTGDEDMIIGTPVSGREHVDLEDQLGLFLNMLPLRTNVNGRQTFSELLDHVKQVTLNAYQHQAYPFDQLVSELQPDRDASRSALFDVMLVMHNNRTRHDCTNVCDVSLRSFAMEQVYSKFDFTFNFTENDDQVDLALEYNTDIYTKVQAQSLAVHFARLIAFLVVHEGTPLAESVYLGEEEQTQLLHIFNNTELSYDAEKTIVDHFQDQVQRTPHSTAVVFGDKSLTYAELDEKSDQLADELLNAGVCKGSFVGIYISRSLEMMVGLFAILKAGAAYVPLDPSYPADRIAYIVGDAGLKMIVTQAKLAARLSGFDARLFLADQRYMPAVTKRKCDISPQDLAYVIYTSGSTGKPKGVMVKHRNVVNFFAGMNKSVGGFNEGDTWLAVTTISFDISVLELFWTLSNGFKVVIAPTQSRSADTGAAASKMDFSLFYFASEVDYQNKYKLLIEGAKFADTHGFSAIWTPERHFHEFGGVYPNPAVTGAAIATITKNIHIRSGSCVLPLHNPIRVAEEWAVVDNLSQGRVGLSFASGWVMNDFLAFARNGYDTRHQALYEGIEQVRSLWEGNPVTLHNPSGEDGVVEIFPKPLQKKLPVWVTAADNPETFRTAGKTGANLLTHLLGQTVEELKEKITVYRAARKEAGHDGEGFVTLMIHTFIGDDAASVKEKVKMPFTNYLRNATGLVRTLAKSMGQDITAETFSSEDMETLLEHAFNRYYSTAALFGTPESCLEMVSRLSLAGVNEIGCLVDFGLDVNTTLNGFEQLNALKELYASTLNDTQNVSALQLIRQHRISHLQCTPAALKMMLANDNAAYDLQPLRKILVGGEPMPAALLAQIQKLTHAEVYNMYGPTETTVWSAVAEKITGNGITVGKPIANTQIYILDQHLQLVPVGVPGELYIGGHGVTAGYLGRAELTAERFIENPFCRNERLYRTGDLGKWTVDGQIVLLGRKDEQVKVRGYRVEPGEIEAALRKNPVITDAAVKLNTDSNGDQALVAYIVGREVLDAATIRNELGKILPDYMIPSQLMQLDALPLTPNGKTDKLALPAIDGAAIATGAAYVPPRNELEQKMVQLWSEVLERRPETIGVLDNFFELGGHSLNAVRLIGLIRQQIGIKIDLQVLFYMPVIEELAHEIEMIQWAGRQAEVQHAGRKTEKVRI